MLELVRRWRAEANEALRRMPAATRRRRAREWARRLNLPMLDDVDAGSRAARRRSHKRAEAEG